MRLTRALIARATFSWLSEASKIDFTWTVSLFPCRPGQRTPAERAGRRCVSMAAGGFGRRAAQQRRGGDKGIFDTEAVRRDVVQEARF